MQRIWAENFRRAQKSAPASLPDAKRTPYGIGCIFMYVAVARLYEKVTQNKCAAGFCPLFCEIISCAEMFVKII
jgi:hypothetical protein